MSHLAQLSLESTGPKSPMTLEPPHLPLVIPRPSSLAYSLGNHKIHTHPQKEKAKAASHDKRATSFLR